MDTAISLTDRQRLRQPHADQGSGLTKDADLERQGLHNRAKVLERVAGVPFYNTSPLDFRRLLDDPALRVSRRSRYVPPPPGNRLTPRTPIPS